MNKLLRSLLSFLLVISLSSPTLADTSNKPWDSFWVSPVENTIKLKPWESSKESVTVFNTTDQNLTVNVSLIDVFYNNDWELVNMPEVLDENNPEHMKLLEDSSDTNLPKVTLKDWVWFSETVFNLWPNEEKEFKFIYSIPTTAKNWPHWWRLVFVAKEDKQNNTIEVRKAAAVNLILRVEGSNLWNETTIWWSQWEITEWSINLNESEIWDILIYSFKYKTTWLDFAYPKWKILIEREQSNWEFMKFYEGEAPVFRAFPNSVKKFDVNLNEIENLKLTPWDFKLTLEIDDLKWWKITNSYPFKIKWEVSSEPTNLNNSYLYAIAWFILIMLLFFIFRKKKTS